MIRRLEYTFAYAALTALFLGIGLSFYWTLIDNKPPAIHTSVKVYDESGRENHVIHRGSKMLIERDSCVIDEGMAFYNRTLVNRTKNLVYFMPSSQQYMRKGCRRGYNEVLIPYYVEPGHYEWVVSTIFVNNPLTESMQTLPIPEIDID